VTRTSGPELVARPRPDTWQTAARRLFEPVDIAWLAAFRMLFGAALCLSMLRFLAYGWVDRLFVEPRFHFKYWGFAWVEPLSAEGMHALFVALALLALSIALGFAFRLSAVAFALGLIYVQLIDVSTYLNHYYLAALLAVLLAVSPAQRAWSVDAWIRRRIGRPRADNQQGVAVSGPSRPGAARVWLYLFRVQVGIVYFFAGMAKAQPDWLLHGQPLRIWLGANTHLPLIGPLFTLSATPLVLSWCGFLFDSTIVGFLLFRRTRPWAYALVIVFHALTRVLFPIGMFPVIMVLAALVFFDPDWPRALLGRVARWFGRPSRSLIQSFPRSAGEGAPALDSPKVVPLLGLGLALAYCCLQLALPLRYLAYGGNVLWHEQGMRFSWRVMVRAKGGNTSFLVRQSSTGHTWQVSPRMYLTGLQESEMSSQPDLILQLAHHIHDDFVRRGLGPVQVRVDSRVALNGRRSARLVDPTIDLVAVRDGLGRADWVLPAPTQAPAHTRPVL
jgi:vitamin K-dependent gamma-carboxylase